MAILNEFEVKRQICDIGLRMYEKGFVAANDGNISVRLGNGRYLCTPTGVSKGRMTPDMIAVVDDSGKQIGGSWPRTSEILLHLEIFHELPDISAVCHAHPPHATAFAVAGVNLPSAVLPEVELFIGQVPIADYDTPGSKEFAKTILPHLRRKAYTILLANHGAVSADKTLEQAYFHMETLDMYCKILLLSKQIGSIRQLDDQKMVELLDLKKRMGIDDPRHGGDMSIAALAGSDDFLRGFSARCISGHTPDVAGRGRGTGIAGMPSQAGMPQPSAIRQLTAATLAGRRIEPLAGPGGSSAMARRRAMEDEVEKLVQLVTDQIMQSAVA